MVRVAAFLERAPGPFDRTRLAHRRGRELGHHLRPWRLDDDTLDLEEAKALHCIELYLPVRDLERRRRSPGRGDDQKVGGDTIGLRALQGAKVEEAAMSRIAGALAEKVNARNRSKPSKGTGHRASRTVSTAISKTRID